MDPRLQLQQALIGAQPEDNSPEQMALAQALMQRGGLGDILALTGDRVIAPVGAAMGARVQKQREGLQKSRQEQAGLAAQETKWGADRASQEAQWAAGNRLEQLKIEAQDRESTARLAGTQEQRALTNAMAREKEDRYQKAEDYKHLDNFNKRIEDNGLVDTSIQFQNIDQVLSPYGSFNDEGEFIRAVDDAGNPVGIPGIGFGESSISLAVRDDPEASSINAAFWTLYNTIVNDISGAAVSGDEFVRLQNQLMGGSFNTEAQQMEGIKLIRKAYMAKLRHSMSAMGDRREAVLQQYTGGMPERYLYGMEKYMDSPKQSALERPSNIPEEEWAVLLKTLSPEELQAIAGAE